MYDKIILNQLIKLFLFESSTNTDILYLNISHNIQKQLTHEITTENKVKKLNEILGPYTNITAYMYNTLLEKITKKENNYLLLLGTDAI